ncbi:hypothetical protein OG413_09690 [Streptomyces sp. NBC_01433]|uniref:hypothetical protein n=1 Tax=Streptomyces sp. NBC_01433 TaxID=2903864 RepID=UPI002257AFAD|nr:hypothetical protein [Streptomyces sp. NBC_01433]MCX4675577.1 hypothetical protein [Streptomyces sp. NBC_01433]
MTKAASPAQGLRVVHLPARTPYARKLNGPDFHILNGTEISSGTTVPAAVNAAWLLAHAPLTWLDVLHLHHIDMEEPVVLERLLDTCVGDGVRVVFTAHDTRPMHGEISAFTERLHVLLAAHVHWVFLTESSRTEIAGLLGATPPGTVIPHGYVVPPEVLHGREREQPTTASTRFLMFGATRPSRDQLSPVINWSLGVTDPASTLQLLLRAFSPADFTPNSPVPLLLETVRHDPRIRLSMRPYPTDDEVTDAGLASDVLLLPYLWGSHSGQLELAFDLNLIPVCSRTGHLPEQYRRHEQLVAEPEWFDWSTGHPNLYGERFLAAVENARARAGSGPRRLDRTFLDHRIQEHKAILAAHAEVYGGDR